MRKVYLSNADEDALIEIGAIFSVFFIVFLLGGIALFVSWQVAFWVTTVLVFLGGPGLLTWLRHNNSK